jgi:L-ascorbate metabolism protein UlaG (beta-lactamase superfamily)
VIEPVLSDHEFLEDVAAAPDETGVLHLWWLGQSGFLVRNQGAHLLIDPYLSDSLTRKYADSDKPHVRMTRRVMDPERLGRLGLVDLVTSSHNHTDHLDAETLIPILSARPSIHMVIPEANRDFAAERLGVPRSRFTGCTVSQTVQAGGFAVTGIPAAHPDRLHDEHGNDRYLGYVFQVDAFTVYHSGDTMNFAGLADEFWRWGGIDLAILPINGKVGNMGGRDAARLAKDIGAKLVIPCHYEMFEFNTADPRDEFIPECERIGQPYKVLRAGERLTLGA